MKLRKQRRLKRKFRRLAKKYKKYQKFRRILEAKRNMTRKRSRKIYFKLFVVFLLVTTYDWQTLWPNVSELLDYKNKHTFGKVEVYDEDFIH